MKKRRGVLKPWAVILLIFAGFAIVAGATGLYLWITNRFNGDKVEPSDLSFSLVENQSAENQQVIFENDDFYTANNFQMMIKTSTEEVTEKRLALSLSQAITSNDPNTITDGVIKVPKTIYLDRPFMVELVPSVDGVVLGGHSVLTIYADNDLQSPKISTDIFVDAPVKDILLSPNVGKKDPSGDNVFSIDVGSNFDIKVDFSPEKSSTNFSTAEKKQIFYSFSTSIVSPNITRDWAAGHFRAENISAGYADRITVYTFANAFYQRKILERARQIRTPVAEGSVGYEEYLRLFNGDVINLMTENPGSYISKEIFIKVNEISVGSVGFNGSAMTNRLNVFLDKYAKLTVSGSGDTLGASIKDTQTPAQDLDHLFSNVGIKVPSKPAEATADNSNALKILGARVAKVENGGQKITFENFDASKTYESDETTQYYILPNDMPKDYGEYFWQFVANEEKTYQLDLAFFNMDANGQRQFFDFNGDKDGGNVFEKKLVLHCIDHKNSEDQVRWKDLGTSTNIGMTIYFDDDDNPIFNDIDLSKDLQVRSSENNVYTKGKYFIFSRNENITDLSNYFTCRNPQTYDDLQIDGSAGSVTLYELPSSALTPLKGFDGGGVYVFYAILRTDVDGKTYGVDRDFDKYQFITMTAPREIFVESKLSFKRLQASYEFPSSAITGVTQNPQGKYLIPAINRDNDNSQKYVISFSIEYNAQSTEEQAGDIEKVKDALANGKLKILAVNPNDPNGTGKALTYHTNQGEVPYLSPLFSRNSDGIISDGNKISGSLSISEAGFAYGSEIEFALRLVYDDDAGRPEFNKLIDGTAQDGSKFESFIVYYQMPKTSNTDQDIKLEDNHIDVERKISGETTISYLDKEGQEQTVHDIELFNQLLAFKLSDQYGREIDNKIYKIKLEEEPLLGNRGIFTFNEDNTQIKGFNSTDGLHQENDGSVHTILKIRVQDINGKTVPALQDTGEIDETNKFECASLDFYVKSEGLSKIEYDSSTKLKEDKGQDFDDTNDFKVSSSLQEVTVQKYVKEGSVLTLSDLVKVSTNSEGEEKSYDGELLFKFNKTELNKLQTAGQLSDLLKMMEIDGQEYSTQESQILGIDIGEIAFLGAFNDLRENPVLKFTVSPKDDASLFSFTLNVELLSSINAVNKLQTDHQNHLKDYLKIDENSNAISVFADNTYSLDKYFTLTYREESPFRTETKTLETSWGQTAEIVVADQNGNTVSKSPISKDPVTGNLKIDKIYTYETYRVVLYKDVVSSYALQVAFYVYLNPNFILVQQQDTTLDLAKSWDNGLSNYYKLFKYSEDDEDLVSGDSFSSFVLGNITSTNVSENFLKIESSAIKFESGKTVDLSFGKTVAQSFELSYKADGQSETAVEVPLIKKLLDGTIQKASAEDNTGVSFDVKYGDSVDRVFTGENVPRVVTINGENYVVFVPGKTYTVTGEIGGDISDSLTRDNSKTIKTKSGLNFFTNQNNNFDVNISVSDDDTTSLQLVLNVKVVISTIGDIFVNYTDPANNFNDNYSVVMGNAQTLEDNDVYQSVNAGEHTIANKETDDYATWKNDAEKSKNFGVFYNIPEENGYKVETIIVSGNEFGEIDEQSGKLKIYHIEKGRENAVIVVRVALSYTDNTGANSRNIEVFYRLKVVGDFDAGKINYPFYDESSNSDLEAGEYLSGKQNYEINLEETFSYANSSKNSGTRFESPKISDIDATKLDYKVEVLEGAAQRASVDAGKLTVKLSNATDKVTIKVTKSFSYDGLKLVGGDLEYILRFNQGRQYTYSVEETKQDGTTTLSQNAEKNYDLTYYYSPDCEIVLKPTIRYSRGSSQSLLTEYKAYISGANIADAFADLDDQGGEVYYKVDADGIHFTIYDKITQADMKFVLHIASGDGEIFQINLTINGPFEIKAGSIKEIKAGQTYNVIGADGILEITDLRKSTTALTYDVTIDQDAENYAHGEGTQITFAHLNADKNVKLEIKIKSGNDILYTFSHTLKVEKDIINTTITIVKDAQFAATTFAISEDELWSAVRNQNGITEEDESLFKHRFTATKGWEEEGKNLTFTVPYNMDAYSSEPGAVDVILQFCENEQAGFTIHFIIQFAIKDSITVAPAYPMPDGVHQVDKEVVKDGTAIGEFFQSKADFNTKNRIVVDPVEGVELRNVTQTWEISIKSINGGASVDGHNEGDNIGIGDNLTFNLADGKTEGMVVFKVSVNGVETEYVVLVTSGEVYKAVTTYPTPTGTAEVVYAEDYAAMTDKHLFAQNRLLKYTPLASANGTYTLKFTKAGEEPFTKTITLTGGQAVVLDLGRSLSGFKYEGTYKGSNTSEKVDDATLYAVAPKLTSRITLSYYGLADIVSDDVSLYLDNEAHSTSTDVSPKGYRYKFSKTASLRDVYYAKLTKDGTEKYITLRVSYKEQFFTVETGWSYVGIFDSTKKLSVNKGIFEIIPTVVGTPANEFVLTGDDYGDTLKVSATLNYGDLTTKVDNSYDIDLRVKFAVENPTVVNGKSIQNIATINAGEKLSLFDKYATTFGIKYDNAAITSETLKNSAGRISLDIYGFAGFAINDQNYLNSSKSISAYQKEMLRQDAWAEHDRLTTTLTKHNNLDVYYTTGLSPRAGQSLGENGVVSKGTVLLNYLAKSGQLSTGSSSGDNNTGDEVDYILEAQGASNDGNHVMLLLTYFVKIGSGNTDADYVKYMVNLEFLVLPDDHMSFKESPNGGISGGISEVVGTNEGKDAHSIIRNEVVYQVENNSGFNLVGDSAVVQGHMYGQTTDETTNFKYTYYVSKTENNNITYNNWQAAETETFGDGTAGKGPWTRKPDEGDEPHYYSVSKPSTLTITLPDLTLGERYFFIEFENDFGYIGRFYYQITSENNPTLDKQERTLSQGAEIEFGALFDDITPNKNNNGENQDYTYESFTFTKISEAGGTTTYKNNLTITGTTGDVILRARVHQQEAIGEDRTALTEGQEIFKKTNGSQITIFNASGESYGDNTWSMYDEQHEVKEVKGLGIDAFDGATIEVVLTISKSADMPQQISVSYDNKTTLSVTAGTDNNKRKYSTSSTKEDIDSTILKLNYQSKDAANPQANEGRQIFNFDGISAFGIKTEDNYAADLDSINDQNLVSTLNDFAVVKVEFWHDGQLIGEADQTLGDRTVKYDAALWPNINGGDDPNKDKILNYQKNDSGNREKIPKPAGESTTNLITSADYKFADGNTLIAGKGETDYFTVPHVNALLFGDADVLTNVQMKVYIASISGSQDNTGEEECYLDPSGDGLASVTVPVRINRTKSENLVSSEIEDGAVVTSSATNLYNDTLEFKLGPAESVKYVVHNADFAKDGSKYKVNEEGVPYIKVKDEKGEEKEVLATVRTASNDTALYSRTIYKSISESIADGVLESNLSSGSEFYIYIISDENGNADGPVVKYGGSDKIDLIENKSQEDKILGWSGAHKNNNEEKPGLAIQSYNNNIHLNIEHANRLSGDSKTEKLYFLYSESETAWSGNTVRRYTQNVAVKPVYSSARQTVSSGTENSILVDQYMVAGKEGDDESLQNPYYIIPFSSWAKDIELTKAVGTEKYKLGGTTNPHQFKFEINSNSASGGAGSAFIDEFGTITTKQDFQVDSDVVTVNVYMKVSGFDGMFDIDSTSKFLGTFRIALDPSKLTNKQEIKEGEASLSANKIYTITANDKDTNAIITLPKDFTLYKSAGSSFGVASSVGIVPDTFTSGTLPNQTAVVNEQLDLHKAFDNKLKEGNKYNISYFVAGIEKDEKLQDVNNFDFNRLGSVSFDESGIYTIYLAVRYRELHSDEEKPAYYKFEVNVYNNSETRERNIAVAVSGDAGEETGAFDLSSLLSGVDKWFEITAKDGATPISATGDEGKTYITTVKAGVEKRTFLARTGTQDTVFEITFYGYETPTEEKTQNVVVPKGTTFNLENLITKEEDTTYRFYRLTGQDVEYVSNATETFVNDDVNGSKEISYICEKEKGEVVSLTNITVKFMIVSATAPTTLSMMLQESVQENKKTILLSKLIPELEEQIESLNGKSLTIYRIKDNNILEKVEGTITLDDNGINGNYFSNQKFLIAASESEKTEYIRVTLNIYTYTLQHTLSKLVQGSTRFNLTENLRNDILTAVGKNSDSTATIRLQHFEDGVLKDISQFSLTDSLVDDFLVTVTDGSTSTIYKFSISLFTYTINNIIVPCEALDEGTLEAAINGVVPGTEFDNVVWLLPENQLTAEIKETVLKLADPIDNFIEEVNKNLEQGYTAYFAYNHSLNSLTFPANITNLSMMLQERVQENKKTISLSELKTELKKQIESLKDKELTIYRIKEKVTLEKIVGDSILLDDKGTGETYFSNQNFLIESDGKYIRVTLGIYTYQDEAKSISKLVEGSTEFNLLDNLKEDILGLVKSADISAQVAKIQRFSGGSLSNVTTLPLTDSLVDDFLVTVTEDATSTIYKFSISLYTYTVKDVKITSETLNDEDLKDAIKDVVPETEFDNVVWLLPENQLTEDIKETVLNPKSIDEFIAAVTEFTQDYIAYFAYNNNLYSLTFTKQQSA